jgi:putative spermidine/putrescine transport system ATP-binding protein
VEQPLAARNHQRALTSRMSHLTLNRLSKRYGETVAVADVSLSVARGESVALLGPSGCGKTTTLRMIAGLIQPSAGTIEVLGADVTRVPAHRRNMGYVFQSYALFPHMSVASNVGFGLDERGVGRSERDRRVAAALSQVRLEGLSARKPRELSGGQQQRVALARALVIEPDVLLLDESLSNLDARLRDAMRLEIRDLQRSLGITTLFVTHDQTEALTLCDRIAVINEGRVEQIADPVTIYERPASRFVAEFVGRSVILPIERGEAGLVLGGCLVRTAHPVPEASVLELFLRPQRIVLAGPEVEAGAQNRLGGVVRSHVFVGDRLEVLVDTQAGRVTVETSGAGAMVQPDDAVSLIWSPSDTLVFARPAS